MTRIDRARYALSNWHFWVIVAYLGLAGMMTALYFVNGRTTDAAARVARETAVRQAAVLSDRKAAAAARELKVDECLASRRPGSQLRRINGFLDGVQEFHMIVAANSKAILDATPRSDPQYAVRRQNYVRILRTVRAVSGVAFPIPTVDDCRKLGKP